MRLILIIVSMTTLFAGCSHSYYIRSVDSEEFRSFHDRASKQPCIVTLEDGTDYKATMVVLAEDTTRMFIIAKSEATQIPTQRIRSIAFSSRGAGAAEGTFLGLAAGVIVGAVWGYTSGAKDCGDNSELCVPREDSLMIGAVLVGLPAAILGALVGSARGMNYVYYPFPEESTRELFEFYYKDP